jgi:hypothetical protein
MREFMVLERISERDKMAMSAPTLVVGFCPVAGYRFVSPRGYASGGRLVAIQARFSWPSNRITLPILVVGFRRGRGPLLMVFST